MARSSPATARPPVWSREPPHEPDGRDSGDHADRNHCIPRRVAQDIHAEGRPQVVRQEQSRERNHDQVIQEQRPAGEEAEQVVERPADERRRAAGLGDRRRPFGVGERDDQKDDPRDQQHERREPERVARRRCRARSRSRRRSPRRRSRRAPAHRATRWKPRSFLAISGRPCGAASAVRCRGR